MYGPFSTFGIKLQVRRLALAPQHWCEAEKLFLGVFQDKRLGDLGRRTIRKK